MVEGVMTNLVEGSAGISYFLQSQIAGLALMIDNARHKATKQTATDRGVRAIIAGGNDNGALEAAQLLAESLGRSLLPIDMSALYQQYCGETENHLEQILEKAQSGNLIVLFDRLDNLFGHDYDVSAAHERHVQLDVDYFINILARYNLPVLIRTRAYHRLDRAIVCLFSCVIDLDDGALPLQRHIAS
jgi:SpoVK/Ycf46/Vps4 family AAA+-type ATPase